MIRWGIIGYGNIARHAIAPAIGWSSNGRLVAIGSRDPARGCSYEALIEHPDVDAIYIGLPNGLHEHWAIRAAEAGKHVLCEKSMTLDLESANRMVEAFASRKLRLVEAFMYRHHPQWNVVRSRLAEIGPVRGLRASLAGSCPADDHRRTALGGGALYDVGCYGVDVARWLLGEPVSVHAVGAGTVATLEFQNGAVASIFGSLDSAPDQSVVVVGEKGRIEVRKPFIPGWTETDVIVGDEVIRVPGANQFLHEVEHFASLVMDAAKPMDPSENGFGNAKVLEAIRLASRRASV